MEQRRAKPTSRQAVKQVLAVFWRASRRDPGQLAILWLALILGTAEGLITPLYYRRFFDVLASNIRSGGNYQTLLHIILVILGLNLIGWFGWGAATFLNNFFQTQVVTDLRRSS